MWKEFKVTLTGTQPLLMGCPTSADKFHPLTQEMDELMQTHSSKRVLGWYKKRLDLEWLMSIYVSPKDGKTMIIPDMHFYSMMCKNGGKPTAFKRGFQVNGDGVLSFDGINDINWLKDQYEQKGSYYHKSFVANKQGQRLETRRARFDVWSLEFVAAYNDEILTEKDILKALDASSKRGIGAWREFFGNFDYQYSPIRASVAKSV